MDVTLWYTPWIGPGPATGTASQSRRTWPDDDTIEIARTIADHVGDVAGWRIVSRNAVTGGVGEWSSCRSRMLKIKAMTD